MSENLSILSDDDAGALARSFETLPANQKDWALGKLRAYQSYRQQNPRQMSEVERTAYDTNEKTAYGLYTNYDATLDKMGDAAKPWKEFYGKTPKEEQRRYAVQSANTFFARHISRTNFPQEEWPVQRAKIATGLFAGKGASNDDDFYAASAEYLQKRKDKNVLIRGMDDDQLKAPVEKGSYPDVVNFFTTLPENNKEPENLAEVRKSREDSLYNTAYYSATEEFDRLRKDLDLKNGVNLQPETDQENGGGLQMPVDMVTSFRSWQERSRSKPGYDPKDEAEHYEMFERVFKKGQQDAEAAYAVTQKTFPIIARGGDAGGPDLKKVLPMLRGLTDEQKAIWWNQIGEMGKAQDGFTETQRSLLPPAQREAMLKFINDSPFDDEQKAKMRKEIIDGKIKSGGSASGVENANQSLVALFRGTVNIGKDLQEGVQREGLQGMKFKAGDEVVADYADDPAQGVSFAQSRRMQGAITVPLNMDGVKLTKAQAEAYNKEVENKQSDLETLYKLREIAQGTLNPLDKSGYMNMAWIGTLESVPTMAAVWSRVGAIPIFSSYKHQSYNELRQEGWSREDADTAAPFMGAAKAALDFAGIEFLKKVPVLGNFVDKYVSSALIRFGAKAGATTGFEMGVEVGQDYLVKGVAKDFAHVLDSTIPGEDWGKVSEQVVKAAPELMMSMALLSSIGAVLTTFSQMGRGADALLQDGNAMRMLGLKPDAVSEIISAPKELQRTMFMDAFKERQPITEGDMKALTPLGAEEHATARLKDWNALTRDQQDGIIGKTWSMERAPDENGKPGKWIAKDSASQTSVTADTQEDALQAVREHTTQTLEEEAATKNEEQSIFAEQSLSEDEQFRNEWAQDNKDAGLKRMWREDKRWFLETEDGKIIPAGTLENAWKMRDNMAEVNLAKEANKAAQASAGKASTAEFSTDDEIISSTREFKESDFAGKEKIGEGSESVVYRDGDRVLKVGEPYNAAETAPARVAAILKADQTVGDGNLKLEGFYRGKNGVINPVFSQPFVEGTPATQEQIDQHMQSRGFTPDGKGRYTKTEKGKTYIAHDLDGDNVKVVDGKISVIDASVYESTDKSNEKVQNESEQTAPVEEGSKAAESAAEQQLAEERQRIEKVHEKTMTEQWLKALLACLKR